jgi:hypothetical protein
VKPTLTDIDRFIVSEGLALEIVESQSDVNLSTTAEDNLGNLCQSWYDYTPAEPYAQDDSGV